MTQKPTLSITIPTHKRPALLKRCLASFVETSAFPVKIHVFDNASGDETTSVLDIMSAILPNLTYSKSDKLFEIDMSMTEAIKMGAGSDYIWCFGDDDALIPGSFHYLYNSLLSNPDFLYLPVFEYYDFKKPPFLYGLDVAHEIALKSENFDFLSLITHAHMPTPVQGMFVCKADIALESPYPMSLFEGTGHAYVGTPITTLANQSKSRKIKSASIDVPVWVRESRNSKAWKDEFGRYKFAFFSMPLFLSIIANSNLWTENLDFQLKRLILTGMQTVNLSLNDFSLISILPWVKEIFHDSRFSSSYQVFMTNLARQLKQHSSVSPEQMAELLGSVTLKQ